MRRIVAVFFFLLIYHSVFAITYYSQGSVTPSVLTNWNTIPGGGGGTPASFTTVGDHFIIKTGDNMTTTATWTVGSATTILEIQSGASLTGSHLIQFTGTFIIDGGGIYIHNNNATVSAVAGSSIWGGTESFAATSNVEIRNWINQLVALPAGISWGNLTINVIINIGGNWNQAGNLTAIQNNLHIIGTGIGTNEFIITGTTNTNLSIGGDLTIDGGILNIKNSAGVGESCIVQVNGSIFPNGGTLSTGVANAVGDAELRFKGDFLSSGSAIITSGDNRSYLVANGAGIHTLSCAQTMNCSFRIVSGTTITLNAPLTTSGQLNLFVVQGVFNQNGNTIILGGQMEVVGGTFNGFGAFTIGVACRTCNSNGTYNTANTTWCQTGAGTKGTTIISNSIVTLDRNVSTPSLMAGHLAINSPGDVYFVNSNSGTTGSTFGAAYIVRPGSIFSLDGTSYVGGTASYLGQGGTLRIGSMDGITTASVIGNVRTTTRSYNSSGVNNFEYFGTNVQVTGDGLPASIAGTLKINNTAGIATTGVTLSQATTVGGVLDLTLGKITTTASLLTLSNGASTANESALSFVAGPLKKVGNTNFIFPIGIGQIYAPLGIINVSDEGVTDQFTAEYKRANPQAVFGNTHVPQIDHISFVEYWLLSASGVSPFIVKDISLDVHATSFCFDPLSPSSTHTFVSRFAGGGWGKDNSTTVQTGTSGPNKLGTITTSTGISSFNPFGTPYTIATDLGTLANPLPVNLITFNATRYNNTAAINWELATVCSKDAVFEVEKSTDSRHYSMLIQIPGSETNRLYIANDPNLDKGITYYRLKMIDENGTIRYSKIVALINDKQGILITSLAPNPVHTIANLTLSSAKTNSINISIHDIGGRIVKHWTDHLPEGINTIPVNFSNLPAGVYSITVSTAEAKTTYRFIKH